MQNNIKDSEEKPLLVKSSYESKQVEYTVEIAHAELSPKLADVVKQIAELEKQKLSLMTTISKTAVVPSGWRFELKGCNSYSGKVNVRCYHYVDIPEFLKPREITALEKLTRHIDIKTLFNSGILTPAQKRMLLNVDAVMKEAEQANEKV